jgi:hypothetical protein
MQDFEPISLENRAILSAQMQKLANHYSMSQHPNQKLANQPSNVFERNRDFVRSGIPWLVREGMAWAKGKDWIEIIYDESGNPIDLEVLI